MGSKRRPKVPPPVEEYIQKLIDKCIRANPIDDIRTEALRLMPVIDHVPKDAAENLARELENERVHEGAKRVAVALRSGIDPDAKPAPRLRGGAS